jgi:hypothetical protein
MGHIDTVVRKKGGQRHRDTVADGGSSPQLKSANGLDDGLLVGPCASMSLLMRFPFSACRPIDDRAGGTLP